VRLWIVNGARVRSIVLAGARPRPTRVALSADGRQVAVGDVTGRVRLWRTDRNGAPTELAGHRGVVTDLAFSLDGRRLAAGVDATVQIWDVNGGAPMVLRGHRSTVLDVAFSPDGRHLASGGFDGKAFVWDADGRANPRLLAPPGRSAAVGVGGRYVAFTDQDRLAAVSTSTDARYTFHDADRHPGAISVSADGAAAAQVDRQGRIRVWSPGGSARPHHVYCGAHPDTIQVSPNGGHLTADCNGNVNLWTSTGVPIGGYVAEAPWQVSYDGHRVVTTRRGRDVEVRAFPPPGGYRTSVAVGPQNPTRTTAVALNRDGTWAAAGRESGAIRVWDIEKPARTLSLSGHVGAVRHLAFASDGSRLLSVGQDATVRVWILHRGASSLVLPGFGSTPHSAEFHPDGQHVITTHEDGSARIWSCDACGDADTVLALARSRSS
ncbi:MAG TPA: WD40 repeat domain-containing protein, partial [Pilimelia sp.]|nr:WD40 repeat domain-containing protein [Pilimelia sp.]